MLEVELIGKKKTNVKASNVMVGYVFEFLPNTNSNATTLELQTLVTL